MCPCRAVFAGYVPAWVIISVSIIIVPMGPFDQHCVPRVAYSGAKPAFHDTDTDVLARILADTSDARDFMKLFLWQAERGSRPTRRHPRDDSRDDVGENISVGVVECGLNGGALARNAKGRGFESRPVRFRLLTRMCLSHYVV